MMHANIPYAIGILNIIGETEKGDGKIASVAATALSQYILGYRKKSLASIT
jgi:hypothetical protein